MRNRARLVALAALVFVSTPTTGQAGVSFAPSEAIKLEVSADFRFRNEIDVNADRFRYRARIRLRANAAAVLLDQVELGVRLATGNPADPNSPHRTLTAGFPRWGFSIDRAYAKWTPKGLGGSYLVMGKFGNPYVARAVYQETVWDGDINPAGVAFVGNVPFESVLEAIRFHVGSYVHNESLAFNDGSDSTVGVMLAAQASAHLKVADKHKLRIGVGPYWIADPTPGGSQAFIAENRGNATTGTDTDGDGVEDSFDFDSRFLVLDVVLGVELRFGRVGLDIGGQFFANALANSDNIGFGGGVAVPIEVGKNNIKLVPYFDYQQVAQESIFSAFMQDDHGNDQVPYRGIIGGLKVTPIKHLTINSWALFEQSLAAPDQPFVTRIRFDFNFKL